MTSTADNGNDHVLLGDDGFPGVSAMARRVLIAGRCSETIFRQRLVLASALQRRGWDVHLCGDAGPAGYITKLEAKGFSFHPVELDHKTKNPLAALRLLLAYRRIVRTVRPDVVHVFNAKPTVIGLIGSALGGACVRIATVAGLGHAFMGSPVVRIAAKAGFRGALRLADAVIFYNTDDRRTFLEQRIVAEEKTHLLAGSGVDLDRFAPRPTPPDTQLEVLFIGRLLREKGVGELIAAGHELRRRQAPVRITVVGDIDPHNPSSLKQAEIDAAVAAGAVDWIGPRHDIVPAIAQSHVVALPSYREGIPLALVEGGAMGRALVASDVPGCRDVVRHEREGLLVPVRDSSALVAALVRLQQDRPLRERLASEAARSTRSRFGSDIISAQVIALYEQMLSQRRRG